MTPCKKFYEMDSGLDGISRPETAEGIPDHVKKSVDEMDALLDKYIGKMFGSAGRSSIEYFLQTGKINGVFRLNLVRLIYASIGDAAQQSRDSAIAFAEWGVENAGRIYHDHQIFKCWVIGEGICEEEYTTAELYDLFLIDQAKKEGKTK